MQASRSGGRSKTKAEPSEGPLNQRDVGAAPGGTRRSFFPQGAAGGSLEAWRLSRRHLFEEQFQRDLREGFSTGGNLHLKRSAGTRRPRNSLYDAALHIVGAVGQAEEKQGGGAQQENEEGESEPP